MENRVYRFKIPSLFSIRDISSQSVFLQLDQLLHTIEKEKSKNCQSLLFISQQEKLCDEIEFEFFQVFLENLVSARRVLNRLANADASTFFIADRDCTGTSFEIFLTCSFRIVLSPLIELGFSSQDQRFIPLLGSLEKEPFEYLIKKDITSIPLLASNQSALQKMAKILGATIGFGFSLMEVESMIGSDPTQLFLSTKGYSIKEEVKKLEADKNTLSQKEVTAQKDFWIRCWGFIKNFRKSETLDLQMEMLGVEARLKYFANDLVLRSGPSAARKLSTRSAPRVLIKAIDIRPFSSFVVHCITKGLSVCIEFGSPIRVEADLNAISYMLRKNQLSDSHLNNLGWYTVEPDSPSQDSEVQEWDAVFELDSGDLAKVQSGHDDLSLLRLGQERNLDIVWEVVGDFGCKQLNASHVEGIGALISSSLLPNTSVPVSFWLQSLLLEEMILIATATKVNIYQLLSKVEHCGFGYLANEAEWERFLRNRFALWPIEDTNSVFFETYGPSQTIWEMTSLRSVAKIGQDYVSDDSLKKRSQLRIAEVVLRDHFFGFFQSMVLVLERFKIGLDYDEAAKLVAASFGFLFHKDFLVRVQDIHSQRRRIEYLMYFYWPKLATVFEKE